MTQENKALEVIFTEVAESTVRGLQAQMVEAIEMGLSERWDDIINAVLATNAPELDRLATRVYELEEALLGTSCELVQAPVSVVEPEQKETVEEFTKSIIEATLSSDILVVDELPEDMISIEEEEEEFDPFAGFNEEIASDEVHDALTETEEFDPFNVGEDDEVILYSDDDMPPVPDFEEEEEIVLPPAMEETKETVEMPAIPLTSIPMPLVSPLQKGEAKMVTYDVFGKQVSMVQKNAMIKEVEDGRVRRMAFDLNTVMAKGNARYKDIPENDKLMGKFYTQMIREWALEIAAANNITSIKGDSGAAILVAQLFYSEGNLVSPALRFRNEEERKQAAESFRGLNNPETRPVYMALVDNYKGQFAVNPMMYDNGTAQDDTTRAKAGYALLHARMSATWANAAGKTECVFPEVNKETVKGGQM